MPIPSYFELPCPRCGEERGLVVRLASLQVECTECSNDVSREEIQAVIVAATDLLRWLDMAQAIKAGVSLVPAETIEREF